MQATHGTFDIHSAGQTGPILLYDGDCAVCDRAVQFVLKRDERGLFRFAALQSSVGRALAGAHGLDASRLDTVILIDERGAHVRSAAALATVRRLRAPWPLLGILRLVPRPILDAAYRWFASRRHRFFSGPTKCLRPTPEQRARFLDLAPPV